MDWGDNVSSLFPLEQRVDETGRRPILSSHTRLTDHNGHSAGASTNQGSTSFRVDEKPVQEFQRQHIVDLGSVVSISLQVTVHYGLQAFPFNVRS